MAVITLPPATITVAHEELEGSPQETFDAAGFHATRKLKCEWYDRFQLAAELKGTVAYGSENITVTQPQLYPAYSSARVVSVSIEPFGKVGAHEDDEDELVDTQWASYPFAMLNVEYASPVAVDFGGGANNNDPDGAIVEESLEPFAEFINLPGRNLFWFNGDKVTDTEAPGHLQRGCQWVYKKKNLPYVPPATLTLIGKVNVISLYSYSLGLTFAAETLLYNPPRLIRQKFATGAASGWDLEYRFTYRPTGWNKFYNPKMQSYGFMYPSSALSTPIKFYELADFKTLVA
jgi:hypothetical protein